MPQNMWTLDSLTSVVACGFYSGAVSPQTLVDARMLLTYVRQGARNAAVEAIYAGLIRHADSVNVSTVPMFASAWNDAVPWIDKLNDLFTYAAVPLPSVCTYPLTDMLQGLDTPSSSGRREYLSVKDAWMFVCVAKWLPSPQACLDEINKCRQELDRDLGTSVQVLLRVVVDARNRPAGLDRASFDTLRYRECHDIWVGVKNFAVHTQGYLAYPISPLHYLTYVSGVLSFEHTLVSKTPSDFQDAHVRQACSELITPFVPQMVEVVSLQTANAMTALANLIKTAETCRLPREVFAAFRGPLHDYLANLRFPTNDCRAIVRDLNYELLQFESASYLFGSLFVPSALGAATNALEVICASAIDQDMIDGHMSNVKTALFCERSLCDDHCLFQHTLMMQASRRMLRRRARLDLEEQLLALYRGCLPRHRAMVEDLRTAPAEQRMYADSMIAGVTITVLRGLIWPRVSPDRASVACLPPWMADLLAHHENLQKDNTYSIRWYDHSLVLHDNKVKQRYRVSLLQACLLLQFFNDSASAHALPALLAVCPSSREAVQLSLKTLTRASLVLRGDDGLFRPGPGLRRVSQTINLDTHVLPPVAATDGPAESPVTIDKRAALQAALARVLKARRTCLKSDLLSAVAKTVQQYFKPTGAEVERELAALVDRDYASVSPEGVVSYVA